MVVWQGRRGDPSPYADSAIAATATINDERGRPVPDRNA
jgi:hypothetical protein